MKSQITVSLFLLQISIFIACLLLYPITSLHSQSEQKFTLTTIIIDPGHGGKDPGNISPWHHYEKNVTLPVSLELAKLLRKHTNYKVHLTRKNDNFISLKKRAKMANKFATDGAIFISIHCNAHEDRRIFGTESYIFNLSATDQLSDELAKKENAQEEISPIDFIIGDLHNRGSHKYSWDLARITQKNLITQLTLKNRNLKANDRTVKRAPFRVLADTKMPAILIELGFLSNRSEHKKLTATKYQKKLALALMKGIREFALNLDQLQFAHEAKSRSSQQKP